MKPSFAEIPFLADAPADVLAAIDAVAEWFSIPAGWSLLNAGEPPDGVWFLVSGSLAAFKPSDRGGHKLLGYIRPGEPVGEMAMLARETLDEQCVSGACKPVRIGPVTIPSLGLEGGF